MDFDFDFDFSGKKEEIPEGDVKKSKTHRRKAVCLERTDKHIYRRAYSELNLIDSFGDGFKEGHSYHFITAGDVDGLTYLKAITRHQIINTCLFSTWCMAAEDIVFLRELLESGRIKKIDAYLGEIFPGSYKVEFKMIKDLFDEFNCGKVVVFKNHSKIFAGSGEKFDFAIETSANINTNPRTENGCITIGKGIDEFYNDYFGQIISFEKGK